jgi:GT2 family glycosyltransferase
VAAAEADRRIAMNTPQVLHYDHPTDVYWEGGVIYWATGELRHDARGLVVADGLVESEWLDGTVMLVRLAAVRQIGLLDERYFLYFEDADWSVRAARQGWSTVVVRDAHAWHKVSRSTGGYANPAVRFYYLRNRYLFMKTHHPSRWGFGWRMHHLSRMGRHYLWARNRPPERRLVLAALVDLFADRWGPYDGSMTDRTSVIVLDALLLPLRKSVDLTERLGWLPRLKAARAARASQSLRSR